jgi:murein DD-endopeptidase MepM/ murein hydrolase activator NlpD
VKTARYSSGYGRILVLDHGYGVVTRYAHNSSLLVRQGERVEAGMLIATVGSTGQSTGPHLHFELLIDDQAVDPLDYLPR